MWGICCLRKFQQLGTVFLFFRLCCGALMGGAVAMTPTQFQDINGFSNTFFGWGGEDDNLYFRFREKHKLKI